MPMLSRQEDFAPFVDRLFRFPGWHGTLRLAEIEARPDSAMPGAVRTPFTLLFRGPKDDVLPEGLYLAEIEDGPTTELYVSPIHTPAPDHQGYQAVFN